MYLCNPVAGRVPVITKFGPVCGKIWANRSDHLCCYIHTKHVFFALKDF